MAHLRPWGASRVLAPLVMLSCALALTSCVMGSAGNLLRATEDDAPAMGALSDSEPAPSRAEATLASMTLEQKIAQLFMVTPETLENPVATAVATVALGDPDAQVPPVTEISADIQQNLQKYPVGGVILFAQNIESPDQTKALTRGLEDADGTTPDGIPLLIGVDEEGGAVARLANNERFGLPTYESAGAVGASGNADDAHAMGSTIGSYLAKYGFTVDLAPDADVNTNLDNPVIGARAFSSDPTVAAAMASAFADGLRESGVIATFKHFPGHGDAVGNSHTALATIRKSLGDLTACEFLPFEGATDEDFVMVGHIAVPQVTGDDVPATLSERMVTEILRGQLGFEGVVVTDALDMGAIVDAYGAGDAAVRALEAGCDLLLMPADFEVAYSAVEAAVQEGRLSEERIDESVLRILTAKFGDAPADDRESSALMSSSSF